MRTLVLLLWGRIFFRSSLLAPLYPPPLFFHAGWKYTVFRRLCSGLNKVQCFLFPLKNTVHGILNEVHPALKFGSHQCLVWQGIVGRGLLRFD